MCRRAANAWVPQSSRASHAMMPTDATTARDPLAIAPIIVRNIGTATDVRQWNVLMPFRPALGSCSEGKGASASAERDLGLAQAA